MQGVAVGNADLVDFPDLQLSAANGQSSNSLLHKLDHMS